MNYGIVAEFNPFHNGHKYLIDCAKADGQSTVTVVMSESFVQRGECACMSPAARAKAALMCGADLVLSLPVAYATASAERFAYGGISVLGGTGVVDKLIFGSETADASLLEKCANALLSDEFPAYLSKHMDSGCSFPAAREKALLDMCGKEISALVGSPNDILAVEYIKAIIKQGLAIEPYPVMRKSVGHHSAVPVDDFCSASAIRRMISEKEDFSKYLPQEALDILMTEIKNSKAPADFTKLETAILYKLRTMSAEGFRKLPDVSEGLEYRFADAVKSGSSLEEILEKVKTKRYTHSRLRRIILCAFLGIESEIVQSPVPYIRVLGFNKKGAQLLSLAKNNATLPIVTKTADIKNLDENAQRHFQLECRARDMFSLALPVADVCGREMTDKIIVLG